MLATCPWELAISYITIARNSAVGGLISGGFAVVGGIGPTSINLLVNARDATEDRMASDTPPESPSVTIRTHEETAQVILEVADEECGIPENIKPKIFDPFFTTKDPDRGTGLGLAVCKSLVEQFGGTIAIRSQPEHGITVTVSLPSDQNPSD
ncbi:MAG: HAMP domain-containing sensor histidine kinase [Gemmatimonadota bacterium]|nr:HAMP domain-containing sensor histidine kinase [Gemmatimonadota bacterium]